MAAIQIEPSISLIGKQLTYVIKTVSTYGQWGKIMPKNNYSYILLLLLSKTENGLPYITAYSATPCII